MKNIVSVFLLTVVLGCQQTAKQSRETHVIQYVQKSPIVALVGETPVRRDDIWDGLLEYGGQLVLEEFVLSQQLENELRSNGLEVTKQDVENELAILAGTVEIENVRAIDEVFAARGLGPIRKSQLLWRNAALRKLVSKEVVVQDEAVRRMYELVYGTTYPISIIVTSTREQASACLELLGNGTPFSTIAIDFSIDSSAERGGIVNPISVVDIAWPAPIREQVSILQVGKVSDPIYIGDRWVIVKLIDVPITTEVNFDNVHQEMIRLATQTQERLLMDTLELDLKSKESITIFDENLKSPSSSNSNSSQ